MGLKTVEEIKAAILGGGAGGGGGDRLQSQPQRDSIRLLIAPAMRLQVAQFLRDDAELALDFLSNVTGVDWLDKEITEKVKVTQQLKSPSKAGSRPVQMWMRRLKKRASTWSPGIWKRSITCFQ